jgi:hypothetical protein
VETLLGKEIERIPPTLEIRKELLEMKFGEEKDSALSEQSKLHVQVQALNLEPWIRN